MTKNLAVIYLTTSILCFIISTFLILLFWLYFRNRNKKLTAQYSEQQQSCQLLQQEYEKRLSTLQLRETQCNLLTNTLNSRKEYLDQQTEKLLYKQHHINEQVRQRISETVVDISQRRYLTHTPAFHSIRNNPDYGRLQSSLTQSMHLIPPFDISSDIESSSGNHYHVTLCSCTCPDYSSRKRPCKHMYRLAVEIGALIGFDNSGISQEIESMLSQRASLQAEAEKAKSQIQKFKKQESDIQRILSESSQSYPWLAHLYSDYFYLQDKQTEDALRNKQRPALKAADDLKRIRQENRELRAQAKASEYQLHFYETLFPWLVDFCELTPQEAYSAQLSLSSEVQDEYEVLQNWLSPDEYQRLSSQEKYQLALDRYRARRKSNWEIGIEYERYIGYLCEQQGYKVSYTGAKMGLEDMGRDLIASRDNDYFIIQCKRWSKEKSIHEKHIFQLFGSCVLYESQHQRIHVTGVFVTTTTLSDLARDCANRLSIQLFEQVPISDYPLIKCNISRSGEKIYHLPFDQQYDRVIIDPQAGEFFSSTIAEAESAGFRRAFRHKNFG